jgi:hypothetical protein
MRAIAGVQTPPTIPARSSSGHTALPPPEGRNRLRATSTGPELVRYLFFSFFRHRFIVTPATTMVCASMSYRASCSAFTSVSSARICSPSATSNSSNEPGSARLFSMNAWSFEYALNCVRSVPWYVGIGGFLLVSSQP